MSDNDEDIPADEEANEDEIEVEFDDNDILSFQIDVDQEVNPKRAAFECHVNTYNAYMYNSQASIYGGDQIQLRLVNTFLPYATQVIYRLTDFVLLEITLCLTDYDWRRQPSLLAIIHPEQGRRYLGETLVAKRTREFFTSTYRPRREYRAEAFFFAPSNGVEASEHLVAVLQSEGFDPRLASIGLSHFQNNIDEAREFLVSGILPPGRRQRDIPDYAACPLLYFVLEIAECFIDLSDHCFLCGNETLATIKPTICDRPQCTFQSTSIGLGCNVLQELRDDPSVCDLVLSIFSCAVGTKFLDPSPPRFTTKEMLQILEDLPSVREMIQAYADDQILAQSIGIRSYELLRWVLFSNRSHLISLPDRQRVPDYPGTIQFMTIISSPESEARFNLIRQKYGSMFLWHGSGAERWHAILRKGLKNATGTRLQMNGAALGPGIYFARSSSTSLGYVRPGENRYQATTLPRQLSVIALCEVAKIGTNCKISLPWRSGNGEATFREVSGFLKDHSWAHTLTVEEACVVRFLMICGGAQFNVDVTVNPPGNLPTQRSILQMKLNQ
jgi:poly [ADP-ribose] polymerase 6/8